MKTAFKPNTSVAPSDRQFSFGNLTMEFGTDVVYFFGAYYDRSGVRQLYRDEYIVLSLWGLAQDVTMRDGGRSVSNMVFRGIDSVRWNSSTVVVAAGNVTSTNGTLRPEFVFQFVPPTASTKAKVKFSVAISSMSAPPSGRSSLELVLTLGVL